MGDEACMGQAGVSHLPAWRDEASVGPVGIVDYTEGHRTNYERNSIMSLPNLPGWAWMDEDNEHVWVKHQCTFKDMIYMLPYPQWKNKDGQLSPSLICRAPGCGFHSSPLITDKQP